MDGFDHSACAAKIRKPGYWHVGFNPQCGVEPVRAWVADRSTVACQYDRRHADAACAAAGCGQANAELCGGPSGPSERAPGYARR